MSKTAIEVMFEKHNKAKVRALLAEFHQVWKDHGEPHPSSNRYINLNRSFFYAKGLEEGIRLSTEVNNE